MEFENHKPTPPFFLEEEEVRLLKTKFNNCIIRRVRANVYWILMFLAGAAEMLDVLITQSIFRGDVINRFYIFA